MDRRRGGCILVALGVILTPGVGTAQAAVVEAAEIRALGSAADPLFFDHIAGVFPVGDTILLVAEPRLGSVRSVAVPTLYAEVVGRRGTGPGEYRSPWNVGVVEGRPWVWDPAQGRMTSLELHSWDVIGTVRLASTGVPTAPLEGGRWVTGRVVRDGDVAQAVVDVLGPDGQSVQRRIVLGPPRSSFVLHSGPVRRTVWQPWSDEPLWAASMSGDGFAVVERPADGPPIIKITRYGAEGGLLWQSDLEYNPTRITRADIQAQSASMSAGLLQFAADRSIPINRAAFAPRAIEEQLDVPDLYPPVEDVVLSPDGSLYLRASSGPTSASTDYWVVGPEGLRHVVRVPRSFRLLAVDGQRLWGTRPGASGETLLVQLDTHPSWNP